MSKSDLLLNDSDVVVQAHTLRIQGVDLVLDGGPERKKVTNQDPRRALVHDFKDKLTINYGKDYSGGVQILGYVHAPDAVEASLLVANEARADKLIIGTKTVSQWVADPTGPRPTPVDVGAELDVLKRLLRSLYQPNWWVCKNCKVVFSDHTRTKTACTKYPPPGGGGCDKNWPVAGTPSRQYKLHHTFSPDGGQSGWMCCFKCRSLFHGRGATGGVCVVDKGPHDGRGSYDFILHTNQANNSFAGQEGFRACAKCLMLYWPNATVDDDKPCPAGGKHEHANDNVSYELPYA